MADLIYNSFSEDLANGAIVPGTATFKMLLVTSSYTPDKAHANRDDITNEVSGATGYTAGGKEVACIVTTGTDKTILTFAAETWPESTITARGAVVYLDADDEPEDDLLVFYNDFGGDVTTSATTFSVGASTIELVNTSIPA
jgi:hypothetical protein